MIDAAWFERISNGLLALCTGLAAILAVRSGRKKDEPEEPGRMEIAGALIDSKEAASLRASIDANTAALKHSAEVIEDAQRDMRDLTRELVRNAR